MFASIVSHALLAPVAASSLWMRPRESPTYRSSPIAATDVEIHAPKSRCHSTLPERVLSARMLPSSPPKITRSPTMTGVEFAK
jgi:hypothetical protein